jgi:hypothetical protein
MSRRGRHGRNPHPYAAARPARPAAAAPERPPAVVEPRTIDARPAEPRAVASASPAAVSHPEVVEPAVEPAAPGARADESQPTSRPEVLAASVPVPPVMAAIAVAAEPSGAVNGGEPQPPFEGPRPTTCTTAQLRRFIKSRPWVPMHELRRRFGIWGGDDDVTPIRLGEHTLFVGLPAAEGAMVGELLAGGDVGYELSLDPITPVIVGVYPMRPVPRS